MQISKHLSLACCPKETLARDRRQDRRLSTKGAYYEEASNCAEIEGKIRRHKEGSTRSKHR
jgi:hypothetical protein